MVGVTKPFTKPIFLFKKSNWSIVYDLILAYEMADREISYLK